MERAPSLRFSELFQETLRRDNQSQAQMRGRAPNCASAPRRISCEDWDRCHVLSSNIKCGTPAVREIGIVAITCPFPNTAVQIHHTSARGAKAANGLQRSGRRRFGAIGVSPFKQWIIKKRFRLFGQNFVRERKPLLAGWKSVGLA